MDNCAPMCSDHHPEVEQAGRDTFEKKYNIDLYKLAKGIGLRSPFRVRAGSPKGMGDGG